MTAEHISDVIHPVYTPALYAAYDDGTTLAGTDDRLDPADLPELAAMNDAAPGDSTDDEDAS